MHFILKILNINKTYVIIASLLVMIFSSFNKDEAKPVTIKERIITSTTTGKIIMHFVNPAEEEIKPVSKL